jgi:hypothetical protein
MRLDAHPTTSVTLIVAFQLSSLAIAGEHRNPGPSKLLSDNAKWAKNLASKDPAFFNRTAQGQTPKVCHKKSRFESDSAI